MVINCVTSQIFGGTFETFMPKKPWASSKMRWWSFPFPPTCKFSTYSLKWTGFWGQLASTGRSRKGFFGLCKLRDQMVNQFYHILPQQTAFTTKVNLKVVKSPLSTLKNAESYRGTYRYCIEKFILEKF